MILPRVGSKWTVRDDFVLMMLVGVETYAQIALRLGRSESAVQRRASYKGYSAKAERRAAKAALTSKQVGTMLQNLNLTEDDLADYLPKEDHDRQEEA